MNDINGKMKKAVSQMKPKRESIRKAVKTEENVIYYRPETKKSNVFGKIMTAAVSIVLVIGITFAAAILPGLKKPSGSGMTDGLATDSNGNHVHNDFCSCADKFEDDISTAPSNVDNVAGAFPDVSEDDIIVKIDWSDNSQAQDDAALAEMLDCLSSNDAFSEYMVDNIVDVNTELDLKEFILRFAPLEKVQWTEDVVSAERCINNFLPRFSYDFNGNKILYGCYFDYYYNVTHSNGEASTALCSVKYISFSDGNLDASSISTVFEKNDIHDDSAFDHYRLTISDREATTELFGCVAADSSVDTLAFELKFLGYLTHNNSAKWKLSYDHPHGEPTGGNTYDGSDLETHPIDTTTSVDVIITDDTTPFDQTTDWETEGPPVPPISSETDHPGSDIIVGDFNPIDDFGADASHYFVNASDGVPNELFSPVIVRETIKFPAYYYADGEKREGVMYLTITDGNDNDTIRLHTIMALLDLEGNIIATHEWKGLVGIFVDSEMPDRYVIANISGGVSCERTELYLAVYTVTDAVSGTLNFVIRSDYPSMNISVRNPKFANDDDAEYRIDAENNNKFVNALLEIIETETRYVISAQYDREMHFAEVNLLYIPGINDSYIRVYDEYSSVLTSDFINSFE